MSKIQYCISKIEAFTSLPQYIDINGVCYDLTTVNPEVSGIPETFFDSFYQMKLPSCQSFQTSKITLSNDDFHTIIKSHYSYINDVSQIKGRLYDRVMLDFAQYHKTKEFLIQPNVYLVLCIK